MSVRIGLKVSRSRDTDGKDVLDVSIIVGVSVFLRYGHFRHMDLMGRSAVHSILQRLRDGSEVRRSPGVILGKRMVPYLSEGSGTGAVMAVRKTIEMMETDGRPGFHLE